MERVVYIKSTAEQQYLNLCQRVLDEGVWVDNGRTGKRCLTVINADMTYDVAAGEFPILNTKQTFWKSAVAEMLGYLKGCNSAAQFRALGTPTWNANANETQAWLDNPYRKGEDDLGRVYGVVAKDFGGIDLIHKVYNNLKQGVDDRREIITFYKPDEFDKGCLRPCMHSHHFSLLGGVLHLNSTQASVDVPLGLPFNMIQCYFLLELMAHITGHKAGKVYHKLVNVHIYEDQIEQMKVQLSRRPLDTQPEFTISPVVQTLDDVERFMTPSDCWLTGYKHQGKLVFPFSA